MRTPNLPPRLHSVVAIFFLSIGVATALSIVLGLAALALLAHFNASP
jgi:hypothetical protein